MLSWDFPIISKAFWVTILTWSSVVLAFLGFRTEEQTRKRNLLLTLESSVVKMARDIH